MGSFSLMAMSPTLSPSKCSCPKNFLDGECSLSSANVSSLVVLYCRLWVMVAFLTMGKLLDAGICDVDLAVALLPFHR